MAGPCASWRRSAGSAALGPYCADACHSLAFPEPGLCHFEIFQRHCFVRVVIEFGQPGIGLAPDASFNIAHDGLTALLDIDMLDRDFLLSLATMLIERFELTGVERHQLVPVFQSHIPAFKGLVGKCRAAQAFERSKVCTYHLFCEHALWAISRFKALEMLNCLQDLWNEISVTQVLMAPKEIGKSIEEIGHTW